MGDMVKELPLKDMESLCTANFTASADTNSTQIAAAGRMNWTDGQVFIDILHSTEHSSAKCLFTISTILGVDFFVYILTPKMGDRIDACEYAPHCARGQYGA